MELTVHIPDDIAERLGDSVNGDLPRRALEALVAEEYRQGRLNKPDLRPACNSTCVRRCDPCWHEDPLRGWPGLRPWSFRRGSHSSHSEAPALPDSPASPPR